MCCCLALAEHVDQKFHLRVKKRTQACQSLRAPLAELHHLTMAVPQMQQSVGKRKRGLFVWGRETQPIHTLRDHFTACWYALVPVMVMFAARQQTRIAQV